jgi:hypothetical protein
MTKRQWLLVAGTLALAACEPPTNPGQICLYSAFDEASESEWSGAVTCVERVTELTPEAPTAQIDEPADQ